MNLKVFIVLSLLIIWSYTVSFFTKTTIVWLSSIIKSSESTKPLTSLQRLTRVIPTTQCYSQQKTASTRKHKSNSNSSKVSVISMLLTIPFIVSSSPTIPMSPISSMIPSARSSKTSEGIHMAFHSSIPCIGQLKSWQMPGSMDMPILTSSSNPLYLIYSLLLNNWSVEETFHHISNWRVE